MTSAAVLGIGNILQGDDGVGVRAVETLSQRRPPVDADLYDGGTAPLDMLGLFLDYDLVVVVDCVRTGREPGTIYRLTPEALEPLCDGARFAHGHGVPEVVHLASRLGSSAEVVVLGVEPGSIDWSLELSRGVRAAVPALLDAVTAEVARAIRTTVCD
jgi:hydrogenase maturation protease